MKPLTLITVCLFFLISCKNQEKRTSHSNVIDIEQGMDNPVRLKTSDFGQTIRYVPLETTDNGLVGNSPIIKVFKEYIVVESQNSCLLFNKKDGSFVDAIGRRGQGPDEFTDSFCWTDEKEEFLYFQRAPNQLLKYDMKGNFCGNVRFSNPPGLASYYLLTDSEIIGYFGGGLGAPAQFSLGLFDWEGNLKDSVPLFSSKKQIVANDVARMSVFRGVNDYGVLSKPGVIIIDYKNEQRQFIAPNAARIWKHNEDIRFKEEFIDTVYTVSNNTLLPAIAFHTGKYHWPVEEATSKKNTNDRIFIADVSENNTFVFFQCIRGLYADTQTEKTGLYTGLFDKQTGETKLGKNSDSIEDDLTRFMPFTPMGMSTSGEFVSLIEAHEIMDWMEKHPEAKNKENLPFLKALDAEMNPIVVLIE